MDQLYKAFALAKDLGLTTDLSGRMSVAHGFAFTPDLWVWKPFVVTSLVVVENATPGLIPEVQQITTA